MSPAASLTAHRAKPKKITKATIISFLLKHEVDLPMTKKELMRLRYRDLLQQQIHVDTKYDQRFHRGEDMLAIDYMLEQPDCFFTRRELEQMYLADLYDEEQQVRNRTRRATLPLFH